MDAQDALWWGLVCMLALEGAAPDSAHWPALDLLGDFALSPSPERAEEARAIAEELEHEPPVAWVLHAAWLSLPPEGSSVTDFRTGVTHAIAAALKLGAAAGPDAAAAWTSTSNQYRRLELDEGTVDLVESYLETVLAPLGLTVHFVDTWFYHVRTGAVHCGTNARLTPPSVHWWDHYDPVGPHWRYRPDR